MGQDGGGKREKVRGEWWVYVSLCGDDGDGNNDDDEFCPSDFVNAVLLQIEQLNCVLNFNTWTDELLVSCLGEWGGFELLNERI